MYNYKEPRMYEEKMNSDDGLPTPASPDAR
jgi:hypothetical protein